MPVTWEEVERAEGLEFTPHAAIARLRKMGDIWMPAPPPARERAPQAARTEQERLPGPRSQSGRRLYVIVDGELRLEIGGRFQRFRGDDYIGEMAIDPAYYRGTRSVDEAGSYELIEGSLERGFLRIWLRGAERVLRLD